MAIIANLPTFTKFYFSLTSSLAPFCPAERGLEYTLIIGYDKVKPSRSQCVDIALCQSEKKGKGSANAMQSCLEHKTIQITFLNANYVGNL